MQWPRLLACITGRVDKELLLRTEYLAAENRILRAKIKGRLQLSEGRSIPWPKSTGWTRHWRKWRSPAKPDTILRWFRKLVALKLDGSACLQSLGRRGLRRRSRT